MRNAPRVLVGLLVTWAAVSVAAAQDLPRGEIVADVRCAADLTQGYALYVPSSYTPGRGWSLLMGFHPAARGRAAVAAPDEVPLVCRSGHPHVTLLASAGVFQSR